MVAPLFCSLNVDSKGASPMRLLMVFIAAIALSSAALAEVQKLTVQVQETKLRAEPQFFGTVVASLKNMDQLDPISDANAGWIKVKSRSGAQGYVHASAVTTRKLTLSANTGGAKSQASQSDIQNAAKGFDSATEAQWAKLNNADSALRSVDRMEKIKVPQAELVSFIKNGKLGRQG